MLGSIEWRRWTIQNGYAGQYRETTLGSTNDYAGQYRGQRWAIHNGYARQYRGGDTDRIEGQCWAVQRDDVGQYRMVTLGST
jgi:hypothetical protein